MTSEDRQLIAEIDDARATERGLFNRARVQRASLEGLVAKDRVALAASERALRDCIAIEDASLDRLANYDAARREVASR